MGELLESMEPIRPLRRGEVIEGVIMRADANGIFVNIGHKSEGIVPPGEMRTLDPQELESLRVGDDIATLVVRPETAEQGAILSIDKAVGEQGWLYLQKALESGTVIEGQVMGFNRGGAIVEVEGVQGFVPMSQLVSVPRERFREIQRAADAPSEAKQDDQPTEEAQEAATAQLDSDTDAPSEAKEDDQPTEESQEAATAQLDSDTDAPSEAEEDDQQTEESSEAATAQLDSDTDAPSEAKEDEQQIEDSQEAASAQLDSDTDAPSEAKEDEQQSPESEETATAEQTPETEVTPSVLRMKVLEVNRGRNRAIFSERAAIQELRDEQKARLIQELTEGEVRTGKVTGISSFGAFVDLGGADGLIHISELSWSQVSSPEAVVHIGQELDVFILRVDAENRKIALSLRRLQPEPWETINDRYQVGDIVDATVTKLTNFGAFARVEDSVEGLIHISELTLRAINHPREVVQEGQAVKLKILRIEPERRRLGLSLSQAEEELD